MRIVIVGGVAGGMSAAARARRLSEDAEIIVLEKGDHVSFANCGLPYHLGEEITDRESLLLHTPESLRSSLNLDVRLRHRVTAIDRAGRTVTVDTPDGEQTLAYDALLLSPGAHAVRPGFAGADHPAVSTLRTIPDLDAVKARVDDLLTRERTPRAVVLGAGFIGLEAVEALARRGMDVAVVDLADHVLPPIDAELAPLLTEELERNGVAVHLAVSAQRIDDGASAGDADGAAAVVELSDGTRLPADVVVMSVGVRPATELAEEAGLELGNRKAITVDADYRTSDPHIWAVGDAVEVRQAVGDGYQLGPVPLAGPANRAGRRAAEAMLGTRRVTSGAVTPVLGTAIVRVFDLTAASTGASQAMLRRAGVEHEVIRVHPGHHAGYFPGAEQVHLVASFAPDGRLLGAQGVGRAGVDKRIDVLATALRGAMTADDIAELELAYAPPYGAAKDPVNMVGFVAQNVLAGLMPQWHAEDLDRVLAENLVLDARSEAEFAGGHLPGALNIPHTQLRDRVEEVREAAAGRPVAVHCASGVRSYNATRVLRGAGIEAANLSGGALTLTAVRPDWTRTQAPEMAGSTG